MTDLIRKIFLTERGSLGTGWLRKTLEPPLLRKPEVIATSLKGFCPESLGGVWLMTMPPPGPFESQVQGKWPLLSAVDGVVGGRYCFWVGVSWLPHLGMLCWPGFKESFQVDLLIFRNNTGNQLNAIISLRTLTRLYLAESCSWDSVSLDFDFLYYRDQNFFCNNEKKCTLERLLVVQIYMLKSYF